MNSYNANSFDALGELESIRVNVPMYLGSKGLDGIKKLLVEIMDNSKDEAAPLRGIRQVKMSVEILPDGSAIVEDNGRGIPVDINEKTGLPAIYLAFEKRHAGAKLRNMEQSNYVGSIGVHGIGLSALNACSKFVNVQIKRDGKIHEVNYRNGGSERQDLRVVGECDIEDTGTRIHFLYDDEILDAIDDNLGRLDFPFIIEEIDKMLVDYVTFTENFEVDFKWDTGQPMEYEEGTKIYSQKGLQGEKKYTKSDYSVDRIIEDYTRDGEIYKFEDINEEEQYRVKLMYSFTDSFAETIKLSVVNGLRMVFGSSHQRAFEDETYKYFENVMRSMRKLNPDYGLTRTEVLNKLNYVIVLETNIRDFANQAKSSYSNDRISQVLRESFKEVLQDLPATEINRVVKSIEFEYKEKIKQVEKYEKEKEAKLPRKSKRETQEVMARFKDCRNNKSMRHKNRVWFLEGDSAANGFASNCDPNFEAYAYLQGKPLNVIKNSVQRVRVDKRGRKETVTYEQFAMIRAIVDMKKFSSFIICTDADVDGLHIRNLISYIFYKYFPEIIMKGQLYLAEAPLFRMSKGKDVKYAFYEDERIELESKGYKMERRYKGLGEMDKGELYTVLTTENKFIQLTLDDVSEPLDLYSDLLDDDFKEEINSDNIINYVAGKDAFLRRSIARDFMDEKLKEYYDKERKIRKKFISRINPLYLNDDGTPMTQDELDMIYVEREVERLKGERR